ncbi:hypothetical protein PC113_g12685 [Phytophthora cactorum]|uniref:Uncharacterized protein n=1 Tax=Phytophthora cactorum TaxID=29920 RepID=A0A8T0YZR8_9STRA|nr:hypothetical protein PC112_g12194 [Phytophthora cactorum]KAG2855159.1 hypothetical protein PC113_g12685 [Phytophthora cactorum]KAG2912748.1 hypothetical protein PC115_g12236 [Phytophthora cactorum]
MKTSAPFLPYLVDSFETTKRRTTAAPERVLLLHFEVLNLWIERLGCSTACLTGKAFSSNTGCGLLFLPFPDKMYDDQDRVPPAFSLLLVGTH